MDLTCSKCAAPHGRQGQMYCCACHAAYMRAWRKTHPLSDEERRKDCCRSYANVYKRRGKLIQQPCVCCGSVESQMHHEDYSHPLDVTWLCRPCHQELHNAERRRTAPERFAAEVAAADDGGVDWSFTDIPAIAAE